MKQIKINIKHLLTAITLLSLAGCQDNIHDFAKKTDADASNAVYIADQQFTLTINRNADSEISGIDTILIKFPVHAKQPVENPVKITLAQDNELIKVYNTQHNSAHNPLAASVSNNILTIPAGATRSQDSVQIYFPQNLAALSDTKGYIIPIKIATYVGTDVKIDYEQRTSYLIVNVNQENGIYLKDTESSSKIVNNPYLNLLGELDNTPITLYSLAPLASDMLVTMTVNNTLVDNYNARMGTQYTTIPDSNFTAIEIPMQAGDMQATGTISYTGDLSQLNDPRGYIVPFEITTVTGGDAKAITQKKTFYAIVDINTLHSVIVDDPNELGTKLTDRTGYRVVKFTNANTGAEMNPMNGAGAQNNMFTDNNAQYWVVQQTGIKLNITIDLGMEVQGITGLWMEGFQANASFNMKAFDIYYATEQEYEAGQSNIIGKIDLPTGKQMMYAKFSEPIKARYIHLNNMTPSSMVLALRQFYICVE